MIEIGKFNRLQVVKESRFGLYLNAEGLGELLLPNREVPADCGPGDWLDVFIYHDSDDRLITTTATPKAQVNQCAYLKVAELNRIGAFMEMGLPKQLLVPFSEQDKPMQEGYSYVVRLFLDEETERLTGSTRLRDFLEEQNHNFATGEEVQLLVCARSELGYKVVINDTHLGLLFRDEAFRPVRIGERTTGYIGQQRNDGRISVTLQRHGLQGLDQLTQQILTTLKHNGGVSTLTDKSAPAAITEQYGVSKAAYKRALGRLLKQGLIAQEVDQIRLL